ncbi:STE like transcription factor-domain containing protein [Rhodotorula toruloides]|uniref:STE like transcription factor-domain containing protein n=1 Tax=Rhodotorula toruloides TaxID=5286 RepID=A0A2S9ZZA6_RHOTO|nr:STE like transcription factor-domain containing protein [Rhodotorula toruloides]
MISSTASALQLFIATAPTTFPTVQDQGNVLTLRTFDLTDGETIACIRWQGLYYVTGTDVVRILDFQSRQAGLHQNDSKAFARGVYSDLRRLKIGRDCVLLPSQAPLLDALFRDDFIKTRKARKLFFWFSVPYDDLLRRVLDRHGILVSPVSSTTIVSPSPSAAPSPPLPPHAPHPYRRQPPRVGDVSSDKSDTCHPTAVGAVTAPQEAQRPFACQFAQCLARFKRLEHVQRHYAVHTKSKPFCCGVCGKNFARADNLGVHERLHERPL